MIDWSAVGGGVALFLSGIGTVLAKGKFFPADRADAAASEAETAMYNRLRADIDALRGDVQRLRSELDEERKQGRRLERHIRTLETLMRKGGIEPPEFDYGPHA